MEKWKVLAVDTDYEFKSRQDGRMVHGIRWLLSPLINETSDRSRFRGFQWQEQFLPDETWKKLKVQPMPGDEILLIFNRHGSIEDVQILNAA